MQNPSPVQSIDSLFEEDSTPPVLVHHIGRTIQSTILSSPRAAPSHSSVLLFSHSFGAPLTCGRAEELLSRLTGTGALQGHTLHICKRCKRVPQPPVLGSLQAVHFTKTPWHPLAVCRKLIFVLSCVCSRGYSCPSHPFTICVLSCSHARACRSGSQSLDMLCQSSFHAYLAHDHRKTSESTRFAKKSRHAPWL